MEEPVECYSIFPIYTGIWLGCTVLVSTIAHLGLVNPDKLTLNYRVIIHNFQIWRLITAVFYYPTKTYAAINFVANLHIICFYSSSLEEEAFGSSDFLGLLIYTWLCRICLSLFCIKTPLLMDSMAMAVLYIWCQIFWDYYEPFLFFTVPARHLPICFFFLKLLCRRGIETFIGFFVGHVYCYTPSWSSGTYYYYNSTKF